MHPCDSAEFAAKGLKTAANLCPLFTFFNTWRKKQVISREPSVTFAFFHRILLVQEFIWKMQFILNLHLKCLRMAVKLSPFFEFFQNSLSKIRHNSGTLREIFIFSLDSFKARIYLQDAMLPKWPLKFAFFKSFSKQLVKILETLCDIVTFSWNSVRTRVYLYNAILSQRKTPPLVPQNCP